MKKKATAYAVLSTLAIALSAIPATLEVEITVHPGQLSFNLYNSALGMAMALIPIAVAIAIVFKTDLAKLSIGKAIIWVLQSLFGTAALPLAVLTGTQAPYELPMFIIPALLAAFAFRNMYNAAIPISQMKESPNNAEEIKEEFRQSQGAPNVTINGVNVGAAASLASTLANPEKRKAALDKRTEESIAGTRAMTQEKIEKIKMKALGTWECPQCKTVNPESETQCSKCSREIPLWTCRHCNTEGNLGTYCDHCGQTRF